MTEPNDTVTTEQAAADGFPQIDVRLGLAEAEALIKFLPNVPQDVRIGMNLRDKLDAAVTQIHATQQAALEAEQAAASAAAAALTNPFPGADVTTAATPPSAPDTKDAPQS